MKSKERMISQLPIYERDNELFNDIYAAFGDKTDEFLHEIEDLYKQFNIDTATWGLSVWERNVGLDNNKQLTMTQRRSRVKARLKGFGKVDAEMLEDAIQSYYENKVDVFFDGKVLFNIPLEGDSWEHRPIIQEIIKILKPAHLGYEISIYTQPTNVGLYLGTHGETGESITIYPSVAKDIILEPVVSTGLALESIREIITVYPRIAWDIEIIDVETYAGLAYESISEEVTVIGTEEEYNGA